MKDNFETLSIALTTPRILSCAPIGSNKSPRVLVPLFNGEVKILSYDIKRKKILITSVPTNFEVGYDSAISDIDGDGKNELVIATLHDNSVEIFEEKPNTSSEEFIQTTLAGHLKHPYGIGLGDINKDGKLDIAIAEFVGNRVSILINKGDKKFDLSSVSSMIEGPQTVQITDIDSDGHMDILTTARSAHRVLVHFGNSQGQFTDKVISSDIHEPNYALSLDLDSDGNNDIIFASRKNPALFYIKNNGNRRFESPKEMIYDVPGTYSILPIDLNGDNSLDFVTASHTKAMVRAHINDRNNSFRTEVFDSNFSTVQSITSCDINQDGKIDILAAGANANEVRIYLRR